MKKTENLSPSESLEIITKAINLTKENMREQISYFLLWGWVILVASLAQYFLMKFTNFDYPFLPFVLLPLIGMLLHFILERKQTKKKNIETYYDSYLKVLWSVLGAAFLVVIGITSYLEIRPVSLILLIAGIGTLVTGLTIKFKPIWVGAIILFILSIAALFVSGPDTLLIASVAMITSYLIPSYIFKTSAKYV